MNKSSIKKHSRKNIKSIRLTCIRFKTLLDEFLIKITLNSIYVHLYKLLDNDINKYLDNCLRNAAIYGHKEIIEALLKLGANINSKDINGHTALTWAIFQGRIETVKVLIENRANLNIRDKRKGYTPLIWAIRLSIGNKNQTMILIVKLLIEEGADFNLTDKKGYNALHYALDTRNYDIVKIIGRAKSDKLSKKIELLLNNIKIP